MLKIDAGKLKFAALVMGMLFLATVAILINTTIAA
jgi:hypothetical protein